MARSNGASKHRTVESGDDLHDLCNDFRGQANHDADFLLNLATQLQKDIAEMMEMSGLGNRNVFGGSDANRSAKAVAGELRYAADLFDAAAKAFGVCWRKYRTLVVDPIDRQKNTKPRFRV